MRGNVCFASVTQQLGGQSLGQRVAKSSNRLAFFINPST